MSLPGRRSVPSSSDQSVCGRSPGLPPSTRSSVSDTDETKSLKSSWPTSRARRTRSWFAAPNARDSCSAGLTKANSTTWLESPREFETREFARKPQIQRPDGAQAPAVIGEAVDALLLDAHIGIRHRDTERSVAQVERERERRIERVERTPRARTPGGARRLSSRASVARRMDSPLSRNCRCAKTLLIAPGRVSVRGGDLALEAAAGQQQHAARASSRRRLRSNCPPSSPPRLALGVRIEIRAQQLGADVIRRHGGVFVIARIRSLAGESQAAATQRPRRPRH